MLTLADASIISDLSSADTGTLVAVGVAVAVSLNEGNSSSEERKTVRPGTETNSFSSIYVICLRFLLRKHIKSNYQNG